jgi:hypothetical protein
MGTVLVYDHRCGMTVDAALWGMLSSTDPDPAEVVEAM